MKEKVFEICAGLITIKEFEYWLYRDVEIQSRIAEDEDVLHLCSIDLSEKYAKHELKKFCFETFDQEEFYIYAIEKNAQLIVNSQKHEEIIYYVQNICEYSDWEDDKRLYYSFYVLWDQYDEFPYSGYLSKSDVINDMKVEAENLLKKFEQADLQEKEEYIPIITSKMTKKRWYEFWK